MFSADLIPKRDEVRQMFVDSIDLFCKEVDLLPLQQREKCVQVTRPLDFNLFYVVEWDYFLEGNIEVFYIHFFSFRMHWFSFKTKEVLTVCPKVWKILIIIQSLGYLAVEIPYLIMFLS